jgi:diguanylate cyclase (GGDEF)-like protein
MLLSAVFRRSRLFFAFLVLVLAESAAEWVAPAQRPAESRRVMLHALALLLPLNFLVLAFSRDRGIVSRVGKRWLVAIGVQIVMIASLCVGRAAHIVARVDRDFMPKRFTDWSGIAQPVLVVYLVAAVILVTLLILRTRPVESSLLWSLVALALAFRTGAIGISAEIYFSAAGMALIVAVVETSYAMAYRDELTQLPSRRALNEALLQLGGAYSIAMLDVDHFKKFNDTYGHDSGDHALRMVASKLAHVTGGGRAYRYGGEEFAVVFPGKSLADSMAAMDDLRRMIEHASFVVRGKERRNTRGKVWRGGETETSVTVSIGVAERTEDRPDPADVMKSADKALYRAKAKGRNCTVVAGRKRAVPAMAS